MKKWPRSNILAVVGCLLVLLGVGPLAYEFWAVSQSQPLLVPFSLKRGEYTSPYFRTYLGGSYQIDIDSLPFRRTALDMDWRIVDDSGAVIQQGTYADPVGDGYRPSPDSPLERLGNTVLLGRYRPRFGLQQRIITSVHQDVRAASSTSRLEIGQPELSLDLSYGIFMLLGWAAIVGGTGVIMLLVLLIRRATPRDSPAGPS
jgi:hypothetical protein